ncbi:HU family DNA-binding protein [Paenibacillus koleovorans]|uniref:HU family DNA-binding protein n=1 Tax=Paenibacillus koleovorans TaxID=121608 RepID=UPI0013E2E7B7|nr:HU family DNA-binding protein [Paenibacillus koleovorans]
MLSTELHKQVAETLGIEETQVNDVVAQYLEAIGARLKAGEPVRVPGLGMFKVRDIPDLPGRNPATGEHIVIPGKRDVRFNWIP